MAIMGPHGLEQAEFNKLVEQVHEAGRGVIQPLAVEVDRDARFPTEGMEALKKLKLLSAYVPAELGGMGMNVVQIAKICEVLGLYCGSTAMIFAMHQIQVACLVQHGLTSAFFRDYLRDLAAGQRLMASATTEVGTGGDLRSSICAVELEGERFKLTKQAPVISYGEAADDIMVTARRNGAAPASDQVHVLVKRGDYALAPICGWDTLGFRATCSSGYTLTSVGPAEQIVSAPFSDILAQTMHPYAHIVWSSLWSGIATDAVNQARAFVRAEARKNPDAPRISAMRLAETDSVLQTMRNNIGAAAREYLDLLAAGDREAFSNFGFSIRINNLKISSSQLIVDIVGRAMLICGISGYRNDSKFSLCRHLRDAYGAALMVNNDRIMNHNATMLTVYREG